MCPTVVVGAILEKVVLCSRCGSPVEASDKACGNCGLELQSTRRLELSNSRGLRISQQLKAIRLDEQLFPPGEIVAERFELAEMLGKGPFGEVYRAHDDLIDADVALKVLSADVIRTPLDQERFEKAMKSARAADRPNLVRIHDAGLHKEHPYISMQLLEGLSLRKLVDLRRSKDESFELDEVERVVQQVCAALEGRETPHGDLKPENIIFLPEMVKVTDSFLAPSLAPEVFSERLGASSYVAPEVDSESGADDARADVYSLGAIVGEMVFGPDYEPGSPSRDDLPAIDALCRRATAFDPAERFEDLATFAEAFEQALERGDALAPSPSGPTTKVPPPAPGAPAAKSPPPAPGAPSAPKSPPPAPGGLATSPLDIETSDDIAEPLEEDIHTVEFDRDEHVELGDLLPTNEVDRDNMPPPPVDPPLQPRRTNTQTAITAKPVDEETSPPWGIIAIIVVVLLGVGAIATLSGSETSEKRVVNLAQPDAGVVKPDAATATAVATVDAGRADAAAPPSPEFIAAVSMASQKRAASSAAALKAAKEVPATEESEQTASVASATGSKTPTESSSEEKPASTGTDCKGGMVLVKSKSGNYCVDAYEFPGRGAIPRTNITWFEAKKTCASRGKRLCSLKEWKNACGSRYPYGRRHDANSCNTADEDGFERSIAKSGAFKKCRSRGSGAYDMVGNVHEWVDDQRIAGGGFESDEEVGSCRYSSPKSPSSSAGYVGFRCCADAE